MEELHNTFDHPKGHKSINNMYKLEASRFE